LQGHKARIRVAIHHLTAEFRHLENDDDDNDDADDDDDDDDDDNDDDDDDDDDANDNDDATFSRLAAPSARLAGALPMAAT
jgi:hypothetical protein